MAELPRGTVTTVFTDIEGSTGLLRKLGKEGYLEELELHRALLREVFCRHGGREVEMQGDCFHFAFPSAAEAVIAAAEAQRALADVSWPRGEPIRVRVGIHTGEPAAADDLYVGLDIHRAARVMSAGHGGQVLLSETTALLTREELPPELALRDLGNHHLKDLVAAERLYQLGNEKFPPLRTGENGAAQALDGGSRRVTMIQTLRSRRARIAVLAGLLILAISAVGAILGFSSSSAPISISVKTKLGRVSGLAVTVWGDPVQIRGTVPSGKAGVSVELQARAFPFRRLSYVRRTTSRQGGAYAFLERLTLATRYRVALYPSGSSVSRVATVYVTTRLVRRGIIAEPRGGIVVSNLVSYPAQVAFQEGAKPIYLYSAARDKRGGWPMHRRLTLNRKLQQGPLFTPPGNDPLAKYKGLLYSFIYREPGMRSRPADAVTVCAKDTEAVDGFGLPGHHRCGDRFIPDRNDPRAFPDVGYLG